MCLYHSRICLGFAASLFTATMAVAAPPAVYDDNPGHPWNKVYHALYLRGLEDREDLLETKLFSDWPANQPREVLDPLLWPNSQYLLMEPCHFKVIALLDEFIATDSAGKITDLRKRAMFQRDLWAVFDWAASNIPRTEYPIERSAECYSDLADRLATIMHAVALKDDEFAALVDSIEAGQIDEPPDWNEPEPKLMDRARLDSRHEYLLETADRIQESPHWEQVIQLVEPLFAVSQRVTPPSLAHVDQDWVTLGMPESEHPMARDHVYSFDGRQIFTVLIRLPDGVEATRAYLNDLQRAIAGVGVLPFDTEKTLSDFGAPNYPEGTILALVRRPVTITRRGEPKQLPFLEKVQYIVHDKRPFDHPLLKGRAWNTSIVGEFRLFRSDFFDGGSGLRRIDETMPEYRTVFHSFGIDTLELAGPEHRPVSKAMECAHCHRYRAPDRVDSVRSVATLRFYEDAWGEDGTLSGLVSSQNAQETKTLSVVRDTSTWHELKRRWPDFNAGTSDGG